MGGSARSNTALYHPFIRCQASPCRGGSAPIRLSISSPVSSVHRLLSPLRPVLIAQTRRQIRDWYLAGPLHKDTLSSTNLHVSTNAHAFFLASRDFDLGMAFHRAAKSLSSLVRVVRGPEGGQRAPPKVFGVLPQGGAGEAS